MTDKPQTAEEQIRDIISRPALTRLLASDNEKIVNRAIERTVRWISALLTASNREARIDELKSFQMEWYSRPDGTLDPRPSTTGEDSDDLGAALYDRISELERSIS